MYKILIGGWSTQHRYDEIGATKRSFHFHPQKRALGSQRHLRYVKHFVQNWATIQLNSMNKYHKTTETQIPKQFNLQNLPTKTIRSLKKRQRPERSVAQLRRGCAARGIAFDWRPAVSSRGETGDFFRFFLGWEKTTTKTTRAENTKIDGHFCWGPYGHVLICLVSLCITVSILFDIFEDAISILKARSHLLEPQFICKNGETDRSQREPQFFHTQFLSYPRWG